MSGFYLDDEDVLSFSDTNISLANARTATVNDIKGSLLNTWFAKHLSGWMSDGIDCRLLLVRGGGWQVGKIRFRIEFILDEPEVPQPNPSTATSDPVSPLDDLRSQLNPE